MIDTETAAVWVELVGGPAVGEVKTKRRYIRVPYMCEAVAYWLLYDRGELLTDRARYVKRERVA